MLVRCHAGCNQERVIAALRTRGLWAENSPHSLSRIARRTSVERKPDHDDARRSEAALAIWQSAQPAQGTPLETYLATRGIDLPPPDVLRFHAGLKHHSGGIWPMMVALVTNGADGMPVASTHISCPRWRREGADRSTEDDARPMSRWRGAPCRAGRCADDWGRCRDLPRRHAGIRPPRMGCAFDIGPAFLQSADHVCDVIVLADGDEAGEAAARDCGSRWKRQGRRVRIARPPQGMDFNDMLLGRTPRIE